MPETRQPASPRQAAPAARRDDDGLRPPLTADDGVRQLPRAADRRNTRRWVPLATGWICLLIGLSDIVRVAVPGLHLQRRMAHISPFLPGAVTNATKAADLIIGLLLLMLSRGLRRRKRRAWQAVTLLLAFSVVIHVVHAPYILPGAVAAVMLAVLLHFRDEFYAVGDPRTRWRAAGVFAGLVAADIAIGLTYMLLAKGLAQNYSLWQRVVHVVYGLVGVSGPVRFLPEAHGDLFAILASTLGLFTVLVTGYVFLRPAEQKGRLTEADAQKITCLLSRFGHRDSLGYFTLRHDKAIVWSPTGKSCIGYRVVCGVMLASGDPIGDPEAWPGAIHAFLDEAARHAWVPAVMGCGELGAEIWCREGGLTALEIGDEAVVEASEFSLEGRQMRNVRQMVARVARQGFTAEIKRVAELRQDEIDGLIQRADSWRGSPTERGFSMALGRVGRPGDGQCVVAAARENGVLRGLLHFVPWGSDGLSLDLMRRDRACQPGVNDFLIVETIKAAQRLGVKRISLNFAVFRSALARGERIGAGPVLRAWRGVLVFLSRWFQIESLYKFNAKFAPLWVPRFFVFPGPQDALRVCLAALEAEAFLVWPQIEVRRLARKATRPIRSRLHPAP